MLLLPKPKRMAMFAIYAFCRQVDDIVDEPGTPEGKRAALAKWREQIRSLYMGGAPSTPVAAGLADAIARYHLPRGRAGSRHRRHGDGYGTPLRAPPLDTFKVYCRRVAGAVGLLAIRVFDRADAETEALALALGDALQMTNILRDLEEDAQLGRLYLPRELLVRAGIVASDPAEVLPASLPGQGLRRPGRYGRGAVHRGRASAGRRPRRRLWTARAMMLLYRRTLKQLRARGWRELGQRPRLPKSEKAWVTLRCLIGRPPRS